jgi:hypothetical protein
MAPAKRALKTIRFTAEVEKMPGRFAWTYVEFPHDVQKLFGKKGVVRVKGTMNGVPIDRALMPRKSGYHMIVLSAELRKKANVEIGEKAVFEIWLNDRPDELELSEELKETLAFFPEFAQAWEKLTPGMKRGMCYWVGSAKTEATRAKRVAELLRRFDSRHPWFGGRQVKS